MQVDWNRLTKNEIPLMLEVEKHRKIHLLTPMIFILSLKEHILKCFDGFELLQVFWVCGL